MSDPIVNFARRVRAVRHSKGLTQEQVADRSGLHVTYIASIEGAKRNPTYKSLLALSQGLGVTVSELLSGL